MNGKMIESHADAIDGRVHLRRTHADFPRLERLAELIGLFAEDVPSSQPQTPDQFAGWGFRGVCQHNTDWNPLRHGDHAIDFIDDLLERLDTRAIHVTIDEIHTPLHNWEVRHRLKAGQYMWLSY